MLTPQQASFVERFVCKIPQAGSAGFDAALKALQPRIASALEHFPSLRPEIADAVARVRAATGGEARADGQAALDELEAILTRAEASLGDAGQGTANISVMKLGKARIEWRDVRANSLSAIATLKGTIRKTYAAYPHVSSRVEAGLGRLDAAVGQLNEELATALDGVLNESDAEKRAQKAKDVANLTRKFMDLARKDPVISAIDGSVFMPNLSPIAPMIGKLNEVLAALGQTQAEATR